VTSDASASVRALEGNGLGLVREIALARRVQKGLETLYGLEHPGGIEAFVSAASTGEREALFVRESSEGLELDLRLPRLSTNDDNLDAICQIIEGVSHFVYLAHRAARERSTTQLELELQAEVDKYVVLASSIPAFDERASQRLRERLYDNNEYVHHAHTELGGRYRMANRCARRFTHRLEKEFVTRARYLDLRAALRSFFHMGQGEKLSAA
jgi:hypothetical protein